jgi:hypothetical protein
MRNDVKVYLIIPILSITIFAAESSIRRSGGVLALQLSKVPA